MTGALLAVLAAALPAAPARAGQVLGSVVTSREWHVKRSPSQEEEFIGDVRYRSGPDDLRADWALFKHAAQQWTARGDVRLKRRLASGDVVSGRGDEAFYNQKTQRGSLSGEKGVEAERVPQDEPPDFARAGRLDWHGTEGASLSEGVHLWGPRLEAWADRADYDGQTSLLTLSGGRPVLRKFPGAGGEWSTALKGDVVTADRQTRKLSARGAVVGWLEFPSKTALPGARR